MQTSSTLRSVLAYTLVALVLGAAIFVGLQVTKNRNTTVATAQKPAATQPATNNQQKPAEQKPAATTPAPAATPKTIPKATTPSTTKTPQVAATTPKTSTPKTSSATKQTAPARVPATGSEDIIVVTVALMSFVFAGLVYGQSRRRLMSLR